MHRCVALSYKMVPSTASSGVGCGNAIGSARAVGVFPVISPAVTALPQESPTMPGAVGIGIMSLAVPSGSVLLAVYPPATRKGHRTGNRSGIITFPCLLGKPIPPAFGHRHGAHEFSGLKCRVEIISIMRKFPPGTVPACTGDVSVVPMRWISAFVVLEYRISFPLARARGL